MEIVAPLLRNHVQKDRLLGWPACPVDARIQAFLDQTVASVSPDGAARLPARTFVLDRPGMARTLSLPSTADCFASPYLTSYRTQQGVLHNPKADRRTTQGVFHVAEGGLPVPEDKLAVPLRTFALLLAAAVEAPPEALTLPFTADQPDTARLWVSLLIRPLVCPATDRDPARSDGAAVLRARQPGHQPRLRGGDLRQRRRSVPAGERCRARRARLDRAHRLRDPGPAPGRDERTRPGLAPPRPGDPAAAARRDVLARARRPLQRRQALQDQRPRRRRAYGDHHRRQLLRVLQEGGEDPDQLRRQPVRPGGGGARRGRAGLPSLRAGRGLLRRPQLPHVGDHLRGSGRGCSAIAPRCGPSATRWTGRIRTSSTSRRTPSSTCDRGWSPGTSRGHAAS